MSLFGFQLICIVSIIQIGAMVQSFPIRSGRVARTSSPAAGAAAYSTVKMSILTGEYLTNTSTDSTSLFSLWLEANSLASEDLLKTKYQRWEQKVCRGRVFNVKATQHSCKNPSKLTYADLTNYYNELVIQLRLAEHNLNVTINLEVKEEHLNCTLKREKKIIKLLNESILPVLEAILNISSSNTNCSATDTLFNHMILLYANCTAVQTSNTFLAQISDSLYQMLNPNQIHIVPTDDEIIHMLKKPDSRKKWCIV